ncbi:hypothetical protein PQ462_12645 [Flavobacterium sp. KACC 22758]|uniref:hypothetical protein n=1 Tax=Flavobacterium sp. KACC 22758 TaxID=3025667 RepID=UPI0023651595|nr:hypothetical protein [Flavobacterium sp. KACC 22758]WDF57565.1 hypothetical protein PQ462_12645 [Flavobacterium sp. KACC 22758]
MKKYLSKFLLCLFGFLSIAIPYFKQKYMTLYKESILSAINSHNRNHFNSYSNINSFNIKDGIFAISNMNYHKIQYDILYNNSLSFKVNLIYNEGLIIKTFFIPTECENGDPVNDFFNHFTCDVFDFTNLLQQLTSAV